MHVAHAQREAHAEVRAGDAEVGDAHDVRAVADDEHGPAPEGQLLAIRAAPLGLVGVGGVLARHWLGRGLVPQHLLTSARRLFRTRHAVSDRAHPPSLRPSLASERASARRDS